MREIYILNKGDSVEKAKFELSLVGEYVLEKDKILNNNYIEISSGLDDIVVIKNYLPKHVYQVKKGETIMDILSRGFSLDSVQSVFEGDKIIISRPKSIRYVVKPLETLDEISNAFGVDKATIMETNNLKTSKLFVGQILWI